MYTNGKSLEFSFIQVLDTDCVFFVFSPEVQHNNH